MWVLDDGHAWGEGVGWGEGVEVGLTFVAVMKASFLSLAQVGAECVGVWLGLRMCVG